jgi:hypothetical protein
MRVLWSLVVVCLVAAGGVGRLDASSRSIASAQARTAASPLSAPALHGARQVAGARARGPDRALSRPLPRPLPPALLALAPSLCPPSPNAVERLSVACDQVARRLILTRSARGPPI